mgnify:FL=1
MLNGTVFRGMVVNDISEYPTFDIQFSGVLLHLSPHQYFVRQKTVAEEWVLEIRKGKEVSA